MKMSEETVPFTPRRDLCSKQLADARRSIKTLKKKLYPLQKRFAEQEANDSLIWLNLVRAKEKKFREWTYDEKMWPAMNGMIQKEIDELVEEYSRLCETFRWKWKLEHTHLNRSYGRLQRMERRQKELEYRYTHGSALHY